MTKRDSTTKHVFKSNVCHTRQLNVRGVSNKQHSIPIGQIELKGQWLFQAGFAIDSAVTVRVMEQCIVLIPTAKRPQIFKDFSQLSPANKELIRATIELFLNKNSE